MPAGGARRSSVPLEHAKRHLGDAVPMILELSGLPEAARPDADEMFRARLSRGWSPTATSTGRRRSFSGHAACVLCGSPLH